METLLIKILFVKDENLYLPKKRCNFSRNLTKPANLFMNTKTINTVFGILKPKNPILFFSKIINCFNSQQLKVVTVTDLFATSKCLQLESRWKNSQLDDGFNFKMGLSHPFIQIWKKFKLAFGTDISSPTNQCLT